MFISLNLSRLKNCMLLFLIQYLNNNTVVSNDLREALTVFRDFIIIASHNIDSKIDFENVILEKIKCIKK